MVENKKVVLVKYSEAEWLAMERQAKSIIKATGGMPYDELKLKYFRAYFKGSVMRLAKSIEASGITELDNCQRVLNTFHIDPEYVSLFELYAKHSGCRVSNIVSRYIIHPLLKDYANQNGFDFKSSLAVEPVD